MKPVRPARARGIWRNTALAVVILCFFGALHHFSARQLQTLPRAASTLEMQVALPRLVQLVLSGGDRYLAANAAVFRALVASTEKLDADNYAIQGRVQSDAAWFNPAHEDNYYLAAAILAWNNQVPASQYVLKRATDARPFDAWPAFYYAFGTFMFEHDPRRAARILHDNAGRAATENNRMMFESIAARWYQRGTSPEETLIFLRGMAEQSNYATLRRYLLMRARRVEGQIALQRAVDAYRDTHGQLPDALETLVDIGLIDAVPLDPYGFGYELGPEGQVILHEKKRNPQ